MVLEMLMAGRIHNLEGTEIQNNLLRLLHSSMMMLVKGVFHWIATRIANQLVPKIWLTGGHYIAFLTMGMVAGILNSV